MAGTRIGGMKAKEKNLARSKTYYEDLGRAGGTVSRGGGFTNPELARAAGIKGGKASRRGSINGTAKG